MPRNKNKPMGRLTKSELALMEILWDAQRPLDGNEILSEAEQFQDGPIFSKKSYHVIVNNLLESEYVVAVSGCGHGKNNARRFAPTVSRNEYQALQISSSEKYRPEDIPDILCSLINSSDIADPQAFLKEVERTVLKKLGMTRE